MAEVNTASPIRGALGKKKRTVVSESDTTTDAAYKRLFKTRDGQAVLKDLQKRFYDCAMDGDDLNREVGRRDVLRFIHRKLTP